jgi:transposase
MKTENITTNWVGIDISKRSVECCRLTGKSKPARKTFKTDTSGIKSLLNWVEPGDIIGMEAGNFAFNLARILKPYCTDTVVLNPSSLLQISQSMKKTDREDAHRLAWFMQRFPKEELPIVELPTEGEEDARRLASEHEFHKKTRTMHINRLHSLFVNAGNTQIKKADLRTSEKRLLHIQSLGKRFQPEAQRLHASITLCEEALTDVANETAELLGKHEGLARIYFSMPGVGPFVALVLLGYIGDGKRFTHASQVSYYAGLVPRVDCSGDTVRYGSIVKRGCRLLRAGLVQAAWAHIRHNPNSPLTKKFESLAPRIGTGKAIVAVSRKMIEYIYAMIDKKEPFRHISPEKTTEKLKLYKIIKKNKKKAA